MAWPSSIPSFTPGQELEAADLNDIRDALNTLGSAWTAYTPSFTAATSGPTLGATSVSGYYRLIGKTCDIDIDITIGSGWAAGSGSYRFGLPPGCSPLLTVASRPFGLVHVRDASPTATTQHTAYNFSASQFAIISPSGSILGPGSPITWATGDIISICIRGLQVA